MNHQPIEGPKGQWRLRSEKTPAPLVVRPNVDATFTVGKSADFKNSLLLIALVEQPNGPSLMGRVVLADTQKLPDANQNETLKSKTI